jgi:hypothetical protein
VRSLPVLLMTSLCASLSGCSTEPRSCASVITAVTASIVNATSQPLSGLSVTDTVSRTGAVLQVSSGSPADTLSPNGVRRLPIFKDTFKEALAPAGDEVIVVVTADGRSAIGRYRFAFDGCFVQKLAGPDTLLVS